MVRKKRGGGTGSSRESSGEPPSGQQAPSGQRPERAQQPGAGRGLVPQQGGRGGGQYQGRGGYQGRGDPPPQHPGGEYHPREYQGRVGPQSQHPGGEYHLREYQGRGGPRPRGGGMPQPYYGPGVGQSLPPGPPRSVGQSVLPRSVPELHQAPYVQYQPPVVSSPPSGAGSSSQPLAEVSTGQVQQQFQQLAIRGQSSTSQAIQIAPASSKSVRFPLRPGKGTYGDRCIVKANHFFAELPDKDLHQYDVSITPEVTSRGVNRAVMGELVKLYRQSHLDGRLPAYDGRKSLYTAGPLPFTSKTFEITLQDEEDSLSGAQGGQRRERVFRVVIKFAACADLHHLAMFLAGRQADAPQEALQVLDIVLRELPTARYSPVGRSFYSPNLGRRQRLGEGLESWRGFYQSIRPTQMGLSLNIDMSSTAFIEPLPVIDFVSQLLNRDISVRPLSDSDRVKIKKVLRGVKVEVTHRGNMRRKYSISGLTSQATRELSFPVDDRGTIKTVVQYFLETYGFSIQHTTLPCLQVGNQQRPNYLPMEVCKIVEGQRYSKRLNEKQITALLKVTCQRPQERELDILQTVHHNAYHEDPYAQEFGIRIDERLASVEARVLPPPRLKYHDSGREKDVLPRVGQWNMMNKDYQAQSSESNYVTDLGLHAYSKESLQLGREYYSQKPYCTPSSCSWDRSSLEAESSSPDAFGHIVGRIRNKTNTLSARPDLASYPTAAPDIRKYPAAMNFDFDLNDSEHRYQRSDQFTGFSSYNSQSVECHDEMVDYAGAYHYIDNETTPFSSLWCFDDGDPSLPRGLQYGDKIPSISRKKCNEAPRRLQYGEEIPSLSRKKYNGPPPRSSLCHYDSEITSFSRIHGYGDEIPSLSRNWRYQDKIQSRTGHWCHDADAHPLSRYQQGASHGNGHSRHHFARTNGNEQVKLAAGKHTFTKPRMLNRIVNSCDHYRTNIKDKPWRNSEAIGDQVRGPRAHKLNDTSGSSTEKAILSPLVRRDQFNKSDFSVQFEHAKFFMIKSYSEDDIHRGIKYNVWASTPNGNNKLDAAFHEAQILMKEKGKRCPVFLFFSVNTSGQFVGLAEMLGPVDFKKTMDFWEEDKWNGFFPITWHIIKDIPNRLFKHIVLENNNNRIVAFSRDTQEIGLPQGLEMLRIFKGYCPGTSILDDFDFYEEKDNARHARKRGNSESTHQARFSDDHISMENLEASMENWSLDGAWD